MALGSIVLKVINENTSRSDPEKGFGIWVIQYYDKDTRKSVSVKMVCGEYYPMNGERRYAGKGWRSRDFEAIRDHYTQFKEWEKNPPPIPAAEAPPPPPEQAIEDCPF